MGTSIAGYAPVVGADMKFLLLGDATVGQEALLRFYVLHVAVLPVVLTLLIAVHFWRIRKDGGLSRPEDSDAVPQAAGVAGPAPISVSVKAVQLAKDKVYGLQGFVRGPFTKVGNIPDKSVFSWPNLVIAELFVFVLVLAVILTLSLMFNAPLEEPVNVMHPPNPAKAPWYFLGLQEMVSYSAFWGGVGVPTVFVLLLILAPYLDRGPGGVGKWFARERLLSNTVFLTLVILNLIFVAVGTFFRGANWEFVSPWK